MSHPVAPIVYVHLAAAVGALALGTWQLLRAKGTPAHRAAGWTWVALMATVAPSSLWIPAFLHFTWIHVFTLVTAIALPLAPWRVRHGDVAGHAGTMRGIYAGGLVIAGAFTFLPGRLLGDLVWQGCWAC